VTVAAPLVSFGTFNGSGFIYDGSANLIYLVNVAYQATSTDKVQLRTPGATGEVAHNFPFTFQTGDIITFGYVAKVG
jgi:hypothetical protein